MSEGSFIILSSSPLAKPPTKQIQAYILYNVKTAGLSYSSRVLSPEVSFRYCKGLIYMYIHVSQLYPPEPTGTLSLDICASAQCIRNTIGYTMFCLEKRGHKSFVTETIVSSERQLSYVSLSELGWTCLFSIIKRSDFSCNKHVCLPFVGRITVIVFNTKQVNLEYILRYTKQNLKHATPIQKKLTYANRTYPCTKQNILKTEN